MQLPIIANTVRTSLSGNAPGGQKWVNVLHFRKTTGAIDAASISALHTELQKLYGGPAYATGNRYLLADSPTGTFLTQITTIPLDGTSAATVQTVSKAGGQSGDALPAQVALVLTLRTASRGRRARGRLYEPAWAELSCTANGAPLAASVPEHVGQAMGFRAALVALNWEWVVASYGGPYKTSPTTWARRWDPFVTPISQVTADARFDTQRRRAYA